MIERPKVENIRHSQRGNGMICRIKYFPSKVLYIPNVLMQAGVGKPKF